MDHLFTEENLYVLLFIGAAVVFVIYLLYHQATSLKAIDGFLTEYYNEQGMELLSTSSLKTADKLKYGIPLFWFVSLYTSTFRIFSALDEKYYRVVETKDDSGKEHIRYIEISFSSRDSMTVNEFDCYEF